MSFTELEKLLYPEKVLQAAPVGQDGYRFINVRDLNHVSVNKYLDKQGNIFYRKHFRGNFDIWTKRENEFLFLLRHVPHAVKLRGFESTVSGEQVYVDTFNAGLTVDEWWQKISLNYADGTQLKNPFAQGENFLRLIEACIRALYSVHQLKVIHCDIKADNICIPLQFAANPTGHNPPPVLLDFAKLRLIDFSFSLGDGNLRLTTHKLPTNPDSPEATYLAPQLKAALRAKGQEIAALNALDYRVDLFSLGFMLGKIKKDLPRSLLWGTDEVASEGVGLINALIKQLMDYGTPRTPVIGEDVDEGLPHPDMLARLAKFLRNASPQEPFYPAANAANRPPPSPLVVSAQQISPKAPNPNIHTPIAPQPETPPVEAPPPVFKPAANPAPQPLRRQTPPLPPKPPTSPKPNFPLKSLLLGVAAVAGLAGGGYRWLHTPSYQAGQTIKDCDICPALVVVPPGSFTMGSPENEEGHHADESPQHRVNINYPLAVGKYEVTFSEWDACVDAGGCSHRPEDRGWGRGNHPVIKVNWDDAQQYIRWLKQKTGKAYRLLSEAEWEYVARAGTSSRYSFGDNEAELGNYAWYWDNSDNKTHPVGEKRPNPFGLYDLHGNVWESVQDCYKDSYSGAPTDGSAVQGNNCASRVLRGGSWGNNLGILRSAVRVSDYSPGSRSDLSGFRVSRTLP